MANLQPNRREIPLKVVYYGPGLSGKATALTYLHGALRPDARGQLVQVTTGGDRTLFFDFLPALSPRLQGNALRMQIFTTPGEARSDSTHRGLLEGVDGVVFVADSQRCRAQDNAKALQRLQHGLYELGVRLPQVPHVFMWNKRDLPDVLDEDELTALLNPGKAPAFPCVALTGKGVFDTLKSITSLLVADLLRRRSRASSVPGIPSSGSPSRPIWTSAASPSRRLPSAPDGLISLSGLMARPTLPEEEGAAPESTPRSSPGPAAGSPPSRALPGPAVSTPPPSRPHGPMAPRPAASNGAPSRSTPALARPDAPRVGPPRPPAPRPPARPPVAPTPTRPPAAPTPTRPPAAPVSVTPPVRPPAAPVSVSPPPARPPADPVAVAPARAPLGPQPAAAPAAEPDAAPRPAAATWLQPLSLGPAPAPAPPAPQRVPISRLLGDSPLHDPVHEVEEELERGHYAQAVRRAVSLLQTLAPEGSRPGGGADAPFAWASLIPSPARRARLREAAQKAQAGTASAEDALFALFLLLDLALPG